MKINNCQTVLFVKDIEVSKDFYINTLGLQVDQDFGTNVGFKNGPAIWELRKDHLITENLGFESLLNKSCSRFELYFETEDITEIFSMLKNKNVNFLHEIHEEIWGQQTIRFFDPDNHLIEIGESMATFIGKFHRQGMTPEQISEKTFVPVEKVISFIDD